MIPRAVTHTPGMSQIAFIQVSQHSVLFSEGQQIFIQIAKGTCLPGWKCYVLSSAKQSTWIAGLVEIFPKIAILVSNGHIELSKRNIFSIYFQGFLYWISKREGVRWCDGVRLKCFILTASLLLGWVSCKMILWTHILETFWSTAMQPADLGLVIKLLRLLFFKYVLFNISFRASHVPRGL